ncbi:hypothetical protein AZE42_13835 [Rhizopogon vesiculosus]|uniref:Uncharacterized protein n=1 Tax=Rhizopogon vesiculosus TaxID=180088 RepID=A0A1J8QNK2_9AGAM|nr:hypothetical protein AZE42_13835 [Rhizopogon vesiculosus]
MLKEKRQKIEELLEVQEDEQLSGDGWLPPRDDRESRPGD